MDETRDGMIITTARVALLALAVALAALIGVIRLGCRQRGYVRKDAGQVAVREVAGPPATAADVIGGGHKADGLAANEPEHSSGGRGGAHPTSWAIDRRINPAIREAVE